MILSVFVIAGLLASLVRAQVGRRKLVPPNLRLEWLALVAVLLQVLALRMDVDMLAAAGLVGSNMMLLGVVWLNRHRPGFKLLGLGQLLNLVVIVLNGGLMPISPQMVQQLGYSTWEVGSRLAMGKDIILPVADTWLWWLSDHFFLQLPRYRVAYSPGDVLIAAGAFWLMWTMSSAKPAQKEPVQIKAVPLHAK